MDYFSFDFDLQRFNDETVTVNVDLSKVQSFLTGPATTEGTTTKYVAADGTLLSNAVDAVAQVDVTVEETTVTRSVTILAADKAKVTITGVTEDQLKVSDTSGPVTVKTVTGSLVAGTEVTTTIKVGTNATGINAKTLTFTQGGIVADAVGISITSAGVISGLTTEASKLKFSVFDSTSDKVATNYTVNGDSDGNIKIDVTGDQVATYTSTKKSTVIEEATNGMTVTLVANKADTVAVADSSKFDLGQSGPASTTDKKFEVPATALAIADDKTELESYYAVTVKTDGVYFINTTAVNELPTAGTDAALVGYFKVVAQKKTGTPVATISFVDPSGEESNLPAAVVIDAEKLQKVNMASGKTTGLTQLNVNIASSNLSITGVTDTASVVINGGDAITADTAANTYPAVSYRDTYVLGDSNTIKVGGLEGATGEGKNYYFAIIDSGKGTKGVHTYSITRNLVSGADATPENETAYFLVNAVSNGDNVSYNISYVDNGNATLEHLTADCWAGIVVDADEADNIEAITIKDDKITETTDTTTDVYTVKNVNYGVVVTVTDGGSVVPVRTGTQQTGLTKADGETPFGSIEIPVNATTGVIDKYYVVTTEESPANSGNRILKIADAADSVTGTDTVTYFKVTVPANGGSATITYNAGTSGPKTLTSLTGTNGVLRIPVTVASDVKDPIAVTIDGDNTVDYGLKLPAGSTVTGATDATETGGDKIEYNAAIFNNVTLPVLTGIPNGATVYFTVDYEYDDVNPEEPVQRADGYKYVVFKETTTTEPEKNYFTVSRSDDGVYSISYTAGADGIALSTATGGKTTIDAKGLPSTVQIQITNDSTSPTVNEYAVTNVVSGGLTGTGSIKVGKMGNTEFEGTAPSMTYELSYKLVQESANCIALNTEDDGKPVTQYYIIEPNGTASSVVTDAEAKGELKYTLTVGTNPTPPTTGTYQSYLKVTYDTNAKTATFTYVQGTATNAVSKADFSKNVTKQSVLVDAGKVAADYTIILTQDDNSTGAADAGIGYDLRNVKGGVTVENASFTEGGQEVWVEGKDRIVYIPKYTFTNGLTLDSATKSTVYYEVVTTLKGKGLYDCALKAIDVTGKTQTEINTLLAKKNYFTVATGDDGNVAVTYTHSASVEGAATVVDLDNVALSVTASGLKDNATITFGKATVTTVGSEYEDDTIAFSVTGLTKNQNVALAGTDSGLTKVTIASWTYEKTDDVVYTDKIALTDATSGTVYYTVKAESTDSTGSGATDKLKAHGVTQYTIAQYSGAAVPPPASDSYGAYFAVSYGKSVAAITYTNMSGDSGYDLSKISKQIEVDASRLASTVTNLNITDTGAVVNYAINKLPGGVKVDGAGTGDTYAYEATTALVKGNIVLDDSAVAYYKVVALNGTARTISLMTSAPTTEDNYVTVTKDGNDYTLTYTQASTGTPCALDAKSEITVNGEKVAAGAIVNNTVGTVSVEQAAPDAKLSGDHIGTISFVTGFKWAEGIYYMPVENNAGAISTAAEAGVTKPGGKYVILTVTKTDDGAFTVTKTGKVAVANATTGVVADDSTISYTGSITLVAPADEAVKIDGTGIAAKSITNVAAGSVLTNIDSAVNVTTAELAKGASVKINEDTSNPPKPYTYTAGVANTKISVTNRKIVSGALALDEGGTLIGSGNNEKAVKVEASTDGVVVTYEYGVLSSITGLSTQGEKVTIDGEATGIVYEVESNRIKKYDANTATTTYAPIIEGDVYDVYHATYYTENDMAALKAGGFKWEDGTYYVPVGNTIKIDSNEPTAITASTTAQYVKAVVSKNGANLTLSVLKNNTANLPQPVEYTGTISVVGTGVLKYDKLPSDKFKVNISGVTAGSSFENLGSGDVVVTADLATGVDSTISVNGKTYTTNIAADATNKKLTFENGGLKEGTIILTDDATGTPGKDVAVLSNGTIVNYDDNNGAGKTEHAVITVSNNGKVTSITGLGTAETLTFTDKDGNTEVYTAKKADGTGAGDGLTITKTVTTKATGETVTSTITLKEVDADVLATGNTSTAGGTTYTNTFSWDKTDAVTFGYYKADMSTGKVDIKDITNTDTTGNDPNYTTGTMADGDYFVKATLTPTQGADGNYGLPYTLTLVGGEIVNGAFSGKDPAGKLNSCVVEVTAGANKVNFTSDQGFAVSLKDVVKGSVLNLKAGDSFAMAAGTAAGDTITLNGAEYKMQAGAVTLYAKSKTEFCAVDGTFDVTSQMEGFDLTTRKSVATVKYTAGSKNTDGVTVVFANGTATDITGLQEGETVTVGNDTYYAKTDTVIWKTAADGTVTVASITADGNVLITGTSPATYGPIANATTDVETTLDWTKASTGYFAVKDGVATVTTGGDQITYKDLGTKFVKVSIDADGKVTAVNTVTVDKDGSFTVDATTAACEVVFSGLNGKVLNYAKNDANIKLTVTDAGAGSSFTGLAAGDRVTSAALKKGEKITIGSKTYTALAAGNIGTYGDGRLVEGSFALTAGNDLTAYNEVKVTSSMSSNAVVTTSATVAYTAGTGANDDKDGAVVTVSNGLITSITGLGKGASVSVTKATTTKGGGNGLVTTTYMARPSGSALEVVKVVNDNGVTTTYTKTFANDAQNVFDESNTTWAVAVKNTESQFAFGDTSNTSYTTVGYFLATDVTDKEDPEYGKYYAVTGIKDQTGAPVTILAPGTDSTANRYYIEVAAEKNSVTGAVTITSLSLKYLENNGTFSDTTKSLGTLDITLPDDTAVALPKTRDYALNIEATNGDITNVLANDVITGRQSAGDVLKVNGVTYSSALTGNAIDDLSIKGDGQVVAGSFIVKDAKFTAAGDAKAEPAVASATVTYASNGNVDNGVEVTFEGGAVTDITDLEKGESVTIVQNGVTTKYTVSDDTESVGKFVITKTVTTGDSTETFTLNNLDATDGVHVLAAAYGVESAFDWGANPTTNKNGYVGYFTDTNADIDLTATTGANGIPQSKTTITPTDGSRIVRIAVSGDKTNGYSIDSLKVYADADMEDVTNKATDATEPYTAPTIKFVAPGSVKLADTSERKYKLAITSATNGQSFSGLSADDTVTSGELAENESIVVNNVTCVTSVKGELVVNGDGTANKGLFLISSNNKTLTVAKDGVTTEITYNGKDNATVQVGTTTLNVIDKITQLGDGESITVVTKTKTAEGVTTVTDVYSAATDKNNAGQLIVTKTETKEGITTVTTASVGNLADVWNADYGNATGGGIEGKFSWTASSTGFFKVGTTETSDDGDVVSITDVTVKDGVNTKISAGDQNVYLKVTTVYDADTKTATVTAMQPYKIAADGTLTSTGIGSVDDFSGVVNIEAPSGVAVKLDATADGLKVPAGVQLNITGVSGVVTVDAYGEKDFTPSEITMNANDTLTTAKFVMNSEIDQGVIVNGAGYITAESGAMKFAAGALTDGKVYVGLDGVPDTAPAAVVSGKMTETAANALVVTVANGVVTNFSGLTGNGETFVTEATGGAKVAYTYAAATGKTTVDVDKAATVDNIAGSTTGEVALAALSANDAVSIKNTSSGTVSYTVGADKTSIKVYDGKLMNGVVKLSGSNITAIGKSAEAATDDVTVGSTGNAVVTVVNGQVTSIKGLVDGEVLTVIRKGAGGTTANPLDIKDVYTVSGEGTVVTRVETIGEGTTSASTATTTAYVSVGGEILTAGYFGADSTKGLTGQFSWNTKLTDRNIGYFEIMSNKTTVEEQTKTTTLAAGKKYLVANKSYNEATGMTTLVLSAVEFVSTTEGIKALAISDFDDSYTFTVNAAKAPAGTNIVFDKGVGASAIKAKLLFTNVPKGAVISNLDAGDKVTTASLTKDDTVRMGGTTYTAGGGVLTFVGEGDNTSATEAEQTQKLALQSGTVVLQDSLLTDEAYPSIHLSGSDASGVSDDITVIGNFVALDEAATVAVKNGVITSLKGLVNAGSTIKTVTPDKKTELYEVLDADGTMIRKTTWTDTDGNGAVNGDETSEVKYTTVTKGGELAGKTQYVEAKTYKYSDFNYTAPESGKSTSIGYVLLNNSDESGTVFDDDKAIGVADTHDLITKPANSTTDEFQPVAGAYYLQVNASTDSQSITSITGVTLMRAGANGALAEVTAKDIAYTGTLTIDGVKANAIGTSPKTYATFNYKLPASKTWNLKVTDAGFGSTFTNLAAGDLVTSVALSGQTLEKNTSTGYTTYFGNAATKTTDVRTIMVSESVAIDTSADTGEIKAIKNMTSANEYVIITERTIAGTKTTKYTVNAAGDEVERIVNEADGSYSVAVAKLADADTAGDVLSITDGDKWKAQDGKTLVSFNFDWTLAKNGTGYFAITGTDTYAKANVVAGANKVTDNKKNYIAVSIKGDGVVDTIRQMYYDTTTNTMQPLTDNNFVGTINITAPTKLALTFDRSEALNPAANDNIGDAKVVITGAIADSKITNLDNGDQVTTAKLAVGKSVTIGDGTYTAVKAEKLFFKHQNGLDVLATGTVKLTAPGVDDVANTLGSDLVYVAKDSAGITAVKGSFTVTATSASAYTVNSIDKNDIFKIGSYTFHRSGNILYRAAADGTVKAYTMKAKATAVSSTILTSASTTYWKATKATFTEDYTLKDKGTLNVNLTSLKTEDTDYKLMVDKYMTGSTKKGITATAVADTAVWSAAQEGWSEIVGEAYEGVYAADEKIAQSITAGSGWDVTGSAKTDTITGAASGKDTISGGLGNDKIVLKGAADTVELRLATDGRDTISGYAAADQIEVFEDDFAVGINGKTANAVIFEDTDGDGVYDSNESGVVLSSVAGKAVTINGEKYYFGSNAPTYKTVGKDKKAKKVEQALKGATFSYVEGAHYYGNTSGKNVLKVSTNSTKASATGLGDDLVINMNAKDNEGRNLFNNIAILDAATNKVSNSLVMTARDEAGAKTTLKGGTYQNVLKSGSGSDTLTGNAKAKDMFWFNDVDGKDKVTTYDYNKDRVYLGGTTDLEGSGYTVAASGTSTNVVINKAGLSSTLTISGAAGNTGFVLDADGEFGGDSVKYFVGKAGTQKTTGTGKKKKTVITKANNIFSTSITETETAHYIGNSTRATNTVKVTGKVTAGESIDMKTDASRYLNINVLDASSMGRNDATDTTGLNITAGAKVTIKGTAYDDVINCGTNTTISYNAKKGGNDVINDFNLGDVISFNNLSTKDISAIGAAVKEFEGGVLTLTVNGQELNISSDSKLTFSSNATKKTGTLKVKS